MYKTIPKAAINFIPYLFSFFIYRDQQMAVEKENMQIDGIIGKWEKDFLHRHKLNSIRIFDIFPGHKIGIGFHYY